MPVNSDKPHLWKADVSKSIDYYNDWFLRFAPDVYREQRQTQTTIVEAELERSDYLRRINAEFLRDSPGSLQVLRMATAPPLARDRLIGLAYVAPNLVNSMEGKANKPPRLPPRMPPEQLHDELERICDVLAELIDIDIFTWLETDEEPAEEEVKRAASVLADRLCGAISDPIIRNAQERRQMAALRAWLEANDYHFVTQAKIQDINHMQPGTYTFGYNIPVQSGRRSVNVTVDCVVLPRHAGQDDLPIIIEAKSAGDFTNTNKRRKEEAQKLNQLQRTYGSGIHFLLLLCGYFDSGYLDYEAAEGIDWIWEHRIQDLAILLRREADSPPDSGVLPLTLKETGASEAYQSIELSRLDLQKELDRQKTQEERNRSGQFATPTTLARQIVTRASAYLDLKKIDFLDPALGAGAFYSALLHTVTPSATGVCRGFEIDPHYAVPARRLWSGAGIDIEIADFTEQEWPAHSREQFDLIATNPPYVRHHHLTAAKKQQLQQVTEHRLGLRPSKLTGLYAYFVWLSHGWLRDGGIGAWLIPTEFMYVNYGALLREYFLTRVTPLQVHVFDPSTVQFDDALVSSAVIIYRKSAPADSHRIQFSFGGTLAIPSQVEHIPVSFLKGQAKWPRRDRPLPPASNSGDILLGDLFDVKRGIATGANSFFIVDRELIARFDLPPDFLTPVLPSPRYMEAAIVNANEDGLPDLKQRLFLLSCSLPMAQIEREHAGLGTYLRQGVQEGIDKRYLCRHRTPWYLLESRKPAPFVCSYMGRSTPTRANPFRFFLNRSRAITPNVFLNLYPKPSLQRALSLDSGLALQLLDLLNRIDPQILISCGRTYGGNLHKLEPKELANVPLHGLPQNARLSQPLQHAFALA